MKYKLLILLTTILLSACWFYIPSLSERTAKETTLKEVELLLKELEVIPNIALQNQFDNNSRFFYGNYKEKESNANETYYSNMSGVEACKVFLEYLKNKSGWNTKSIREECDGSERKYKDELFISVGARKKSSDEYANPIFSLNIDIKESTTGFHRQTPEDTKWKTMIRIAIRSALDISSGCNVELSSCANADWHEERAK
jgi:hypothetical protein